MEEKIGQSGTAEKKSGKKKWLIVAAVIVIAALAVVLIFALNGSGRDDGVPMGKSSVAETANGEIVTPVGTLTFPTEWPAAFGRKTLHPETCIPKNSTAA